MATPSIHVWDRVYVNGLGRLGALVYWHLDYRFTGADPWTFEVQWAPQEAGPWESLETDITTNFYQDSVRRQFGKYKNTFYRVILKDGNNLTYTSPIVSPRGIWNRHDFLLAREITRKEYLLQSRYTGRPGLLFHRYTIGTLCTNCADYDTKEPTSAQCAVCFGTGLVGGFAPPIPVPVIADLSNSSANFRDQADQEDPVAFRGRVVGFPDINRGDIWLDLNTDDRFMLRDINNIAALRGQAIINQIELRLIPASDKIYELPRDWDGGLP